MPSSQRTSKVSHAAARDRLTSDLRFEPPRAVTPEAAAQKRVTQAYAAYRDALEDFFRGRCGSAELMHARVQLCAAESARVDQRRSEPKSMEDTSERWRAHHAKHTTTNR